MALIHWEVYDPHLLIFYLFIEQIATKSERHEERRVIKGRQLENKYGAHDSQIKTIFEAIKHLFEPQKKVKKRIGF